jgi:hypothetical protein
MVEWHLIFKSSLNTSFNCKPACGYQDSTTYFQLLVNQLLVISTEKITPWASHAAIEIANTL